VNLLRIRLRRSTWIALVAALAMAVMPTLSRAMAFANGEDGWAQVCTAQGMKMVAVADLGTPADPSAPSSSGASLDHCKYCTASAGAAPLPAAPASVPVPLAQASAAPAAFFHAPRTLFAWASAQPRAPPVLS
jgi:Protein of unknown function (DUF2946)